MRAFYATQEHVRGFVLGTPEGWQAALYDLTRQQWLPMGRCLYDFLPHAKAAVEDRAGELLGGAPVRMKWH